MNYRENNKKKKDGKKVNFIVILFWEEKLYFLKTWSPRLQTRAFLKAEPTPTPGGGGGVQPSLGLGAGLPPCSRPRNSLPRHRVSQKNCSLPYRPVNFLKLCRSVNIPQFNFVISQASVGHQKVKVAGLTLFFLGGAHQHICAHSCSSVFV